MRRATLITFLLLATAVLIGADERHPYTFDDHIAMQRLSAPVLSPDGEWIAFSVTSFDKEANSGSTDIYLAPARGGEPVRLTAHEAGSSSPAWSPDGRTIAFVSSRSGTSQIWLIPVDGGEARQLTEIPTGASGPKWSPDGSHIIFYSMVWPDCEDDDCNAQRLEERENSPVQAVIADELLFRHWDTWRDDGRKRHLFVVDVETGEHRDLLPGADYDCPPFPFGGRGDYDISPDGSEVAFAAKVDPNPAWHTDIDIFVVPFEGGDPVCITEELEGEDSHPAYSPDGRWIAFGARERPGFESDQWEIILYDRETGVKRNLSENFDRMITEFAWSPDDSSLIYLLADQHGRRPVFQVSLADAEFEMLDGSGYNFSLSVPNSGSAAYYAKTSLSSPSEVYRVNEGIEPQRLTFFTQPLMDQLELGEVRDVWFEGYNGDRVQMYLVFPPGFDPEKKWPLHQLIHGGPQQNYADLWTYGWNSQLFAAQGHVVALVCFHATPGYGQDFTDSVSHNWGGAPFEDIMLATDYLIGQGYIDEERMAATGGSYGGYMVDWICGHTDRFACLVTHAGVYNLESMYGATEELWFPEWDLNGPYWENPELYERWSPHRYAANFRTPTLVIHGQLDFRVPVTQGFEFFTALQRQGVESRLLYYPDEDHWILGPQNKMLWYHQFIGWLERFIGSGPTEE